jgi:hypothetical protein
MKAKLDSAYKLGVTTERARILWIVDEERKWLRKKLEEVILVESQRHAMQVKVKMATAIFAQLSLRIISGAAPPPVPKEEQEDDERHEGTGRDPGIPG